MPDSLGIAGWIGFVKELSESPDPARMAALGACLLWNVS